MTKFEDIMNYLKQDFFMKKDITKLRSKDLEEFEYLMNNIPNEVDHEFAYNSWICGPGNKYKLTNTQAMNRVNCFIVCYLNHNYNKGKKK